MTNPRLYPDYLGDIVYAAGKAREFTLGMDFADFTADDKTIFAVIRAVEIMGEAPRRTPSEVLDLYPQIPWRHIVNMRNRVIHNCDDVHLHIVWDVVVRDVPHLLAALGTDRA